jgi:hypothetical protein
LSECCPVDLTAGAKEGEVWRSHLVMCYWLAYNRRDMLRENPPLRKNRLQKDMRIAAIALTLDATVVTRNRRDFERVPGIKLVDWTLL